MPGMSQVIYARGEVDGREKGRLEGRSEGQNDLINAINRLRKGESREEIIASGIDEHTVDLAMVVK